LSGILVMVATYLFLSRNVIRIILGSSLLSHAVHLLLMAVGGLKKGGVPLAGEESTFTDALPQALILTAIVINLPLKAILRVVAYDRSRTTGTYNLLTFGGFKK